MGRPQKIALGVFASLLLLVLLLAVQANRRSGFVSDMYDEEIGGEEISRGPLACEEMEEETEEAASQEPPKTELPVGKLYADSSIPSLRAGGGVEFGTPISCGNKSLIPLYPQSADVCIHEEFLTIAEAVEEGCARIEDSGVVEIVYVVNQSNRPILLLCGEIIFGGNQDRVIAQDTVIPAGQGKKYPVKVFCVERGRWHESETGFAFTCRPEPCKKEKSSDNEDSGTRSTAASLADANEHQRQEDTFLNLAGQNIVYACLLSECGEGGQGEVWSRVSETNKRLGTENPTNTYRNNLLSPGVHERMKGEFEIFVQATAHDNRAIGYAFSFDGNVFYIDIFASPELCQKYRTRLIKAYLLETLGKGNNLESAPTEAELTSFLNWVETKRLAEKARPGYAFYKSGFLVGYDCTYEGKRLHSGYYHEGTSGK